jgi:hypothetical protein
LTINSNTGDEGIDYILSCTSPTQLFVSRLSDCLRSYGIECIPHVCRQKSTLRSELNNLHIKAGKRVIIFTDVLSTGSLVNEMISTLVDSQGVNVIGIIALIDLRSEQNNKTTNAITTAPLSAMLKNRLWTLITDHIDKSNTMAYAWYVDPETLVLKRRRQGDLWLQLTEEGYSPIGSLARMQSMFATPRTLLKRLSDSNALLAGHFAHGTHHSEMACDVGRLLASHSIRNAIVRTLIRYITLNNIKFIIYPNNSQVYIIADELSYRLGRHEPDTSHSETIGADVIPAFWFNNLFNETDYHLPPIRNLTINSLIPNTMILDDGACSGSTIKALLREIVGTYPKEVIDKGSIHICVLVNRMTETSTGFWESLNIQAADHISFSSFFTIPIPAYSSSQCPLCKEVLYAQSASEDEHRSNYERRFYKSWASHSSAKSLNTASPNVPPPKEWLSGETAITYAGCLLALSRGNIKLAWDHMQTSRELSVLLIKPLLIRSIDVQTKDIGTDQIIEYICRTCEKADDHSDPDILRNWEFRVLSGYTSGSQPPGPWDLSR